MAHTTIGQPPVYERSDGQDLPWLALDKESLEDGRLIPVDGVTGLPFDGVVDVSMHYPLNDVITVTLTVHMRIRDHRTADEAVRRYPPDGRYYETGAPCTCVAACEQPCKGACGCKACVQSYGDFLSEDR